jgi:acetyltransferase-like isoleucine patch superfamily enzyme/SAM-dependent methyltransferase
MQRESNPGPANRSEPQVDLPETGERCIPGRSDLPTYYEHVHRYLWACDFVEGKDVLDVGSGSGYGSEMLSRVAKSVVGIDIDRTAVAFSRSHYQRPNLAYVEGSALELDGCPDGSADVAVCFEVLEHVEHHERLLAAIKRVLRADGLLLLSTPDRELYSDLSGYVNPFHARELYAHEFRALVGRHFRSTIEWRQGFVNGSVIASLSDREAAFTENAGYILDGAWHRTAAEWKPYMLVAASDSPVPYLPSVHLLADVNQAFTHQAFDWRREASEGLQARAEVERVRSDLQSSQNENEELARVRDEYAAVIASRSWRLLTHGFALAARLRRAANHDSSKAISWRRPTDMPSSESGPEPPDGTSTRVVLPAHLTMGRHSYGAPRVLVYPGDTAVARVGSFCSIAADTEFMPGGLHNMKSVSTFPIRIVWGMAQPPADGMPDTKGDIIVGNDVWIGHGATVLSGVYIGDGAVIGARAVVASDVRPYAVVVGNPAREVRRRFSDDVVEALLRIRWWDWPDALIVERASLLNSGAPQDFVERFDPGVAGEPH